MADQTPRITLVTQAFASWLDEHPELAHLIGDAVLSAASSEYRTDIHLSTRGYDRTEMQRRVDQFAAALGVPSNQGFDPVVPTGQRARDWDRQWSVDAYLDFRGVRINWHLTAVRLVPSSEGSGDA